MKGEKTWVLKEKFPKEDKWTNTSILHDEDDSSCDKNKVHAHIKGMQNPRSHN